MEKVWLKSYPAGVPEEIDLDAYQSVVTDVFEQSIRALWGERPCFSNLGTTLTYNEMDRYTDQLASYLQNLPGMEKGDRVVIMMPNMLQNPISIFASLARRLHGGQYQSAVYRAGTRTSAGIRFRRQGNHRDGKFLPYASEIIDKTSIQHVVTTQLGDLLHFPKSLIVNLVVKYVKKMVPQFSLPRSGKL